MAAGGTHSDREIGNDADLHSCSLGLVLRLCQRTIRDPLQKDMEKNLAFVFVAKALDRRTVRIAPLRRPIPPIPVLRFSLQVRRMQGFEQGMLLERGTGAGTKGGKVDNEIAVAGAAEIVRDKTIKQAAQQHKLILGRFGPIDQRCGLKRS